MAQVLLIQKDKNIRENWTELLRLLKYQVEEYSDLPSLSKWTVKLKQPLSQFLQKFDLVIADTDVVGFDALALKQILNNDFARIPLILTSADNVPEWSLDREELGGVSFLREPFENSLLLEYVSKALKFQALLRDGDANKAVAKLLLNQPNALPTEYSLKRSYTLGRYRDSDEYHADIRLLSASASRKHAYLIRIYKGRESYYKLVDFSSNGININGRRMPKMARLTHGDEIEFYPGCKATYTEIAREDNDLDATLTNGQ